MAKIILIFLIAALGLDAQELGVTVRTVTFSSPERVLTMGVRLPNNGGTTELTVERENFGNKVTLKPGTYLATIENLGKSAQFVIPEKGFVSCFLLVLVSSDNPLVIVPVPDDSKSIPFESYHIINALDREVAVQFDKQEVVLGPGRSNTFLMPRLTDPDGLFRMKMSTLFKGKAHATQFFATFCPYESGRRYISLIYQDPAFTLPRVRSVPDFRVAERGMSVR